MPRALWILVLLNCFPGVLSAGECPIFSGKYRPTDDRFSDAELRTTPHPEGCEVQIRFGTCRLKFIAKEATDWNGLGCEGADIDVEITSKKEFVGHLNVRLHGRFDFPYKMVWPRPVAPEFSYKDGTFIISNRPSQYEEEYLLKDMIKKSFDYAEGQVYFRIRGGPYPNLKAVDNEKIVFHGGEFHRVPGKYEFEVDACQIVHENKCSTARWVFDVW